MNGAQEERAAAEELAKARQLEEGFSEPTPDGVTEEEVGSLKEELTRAREAVANTASRALTAENKLRRYEAKYGPLED